MEAARPATVDDLDAMVELVRAGTEELAPGRGGSIWRRREARVEPVAASIHGAIAGEIERSIAVVGTIDEVVVGYGVMVVETLHDGAKLAVVQDIYVDRLARGVGVGEAMLDLLVASARDEGAVGIDALALPGDRATKNFFESFGLTARAIIVHRNLTDEAATAP